MAGPGFGAIAGVDNYNAKAGNGLGPVTTIVSMPTADQAALDAQVQELGLTHSIAGVTGAAGGTVHVALQGTAAVPTPINTNVVVTTVVAFTD